MIVCKDKARTCHLLTSVYTLRPDPLYLQTKSYSPLSLKEWLAISIFQE